MEQFESEWHAWHDERLAALATPFGFLSVTGLHWLGPGTTTWDSAPGHFELDGDRISFRVDPGRSVGPTAATMDAQNNPASHPGAEFGRDAEGTPWIRLLSPGHSHLWMVADNVAYEVLERDGRLGIRVRDSKSQLLQNFVEVPTFPLDVDWTVTGTFTPYPQPRTVRIATAFPGLEADAVTVGTVAFELDGHTHRLTVTGSPETGLRADFHDYTNGDSTPGWRTLSLGVPDAAGKVILDFNRTTVYPFAFLPWATCPAPVPENILPLAVAAGELKPLRTMGESGINHPVGIVDLSRGFEMPEALDWLAEAGADVIRFRVHAGVPMPGPIAADAFIIAGISGTPGHASEDTVAQIREFVEDALAVGTPVVGIGSSGTEVVRAAARVCSRAESVQADSAPADPAQGDTGLGWSVPPDADATGLGLGSAESPPVLVSQDLAHDRLLKPYVTVDEPSGLGYVDIDALAGSSGDGAKGRRRVWFELIDRFARTVLTRG